MNKINNFIKINYLLKYVFLFLITICLLFFFIFKKKKINNIQIYSVNYEFPYNFDSVKIYELPKELHEISGIAYFKNDILACIQDEEGIIFIFDLQTKKISGKIQFSKKGDFEGIEYIKNEFWVLNSKGDLFHIIKNKQTDYLNIQKYKTALSKKNNTEGLAYDSINNRLLIVCKGQPKINDNDYSSKKSVYSFDLDNKLLIKKPFLNIDLKKIKEFKKYDKITRIWLKFISILYPSEGNFTFKPSGIAIHPFSQNIYILASSGKLLLVTDSNSNFLFAIRLNSKLFKKPEGICFDPLGNLYISNEGITTNATILKIKPK